MYSCHYTAVFIVVARAACGVQVPTLRRAQDGRKWSAGKFKDMFAHQREEAQNGGCSPESVLNYLEIWLRHRTHRRFMWHFLADWVLNKILGPEPMQLYY
jgi:hypothetical protein